MKYWAYVNNEILGPFEKEQLRELPSFSPALLVCPQTPVGEKTEDWKEATAYPELAALTGAPPQTQPAPEPAAAPAPEPAVQPVETLTPQGFAEPAINTTNLNFKPLTGAQSVEPIPPTSHPVGMADISVGHLGGAAAEPAQPQEPAPAAQEQPAEQSAEPAEQPSQGSSGFDPISLSQIVRRGETLSGQETPPAGAAPEGMTLEPRADAVPAPAQEAPSFSSAAEPPQAAAEQPAPAQAAAQQVMDTAGLERLIKKLDAISETSATRNDVSSAVDPLRLKLDQMGEVISSIKNSQLQQEGMLKLNYLEGAVTELKETLKNLPKTAAAPAPAPREVEIDRTTDVMFGAQPMPEPEKEKPQAVKPKEEPAKEPAIEEIQDQGSKKSNIGMAIKKAAKMLLTLVLLIAVLLGAVIGLKTFGIFDATKFLPFPLPFISEPAAAPAEPQATAEVTAPQEPAGEQQADAQAAAPVDGTQSAAGAEGQQGVMNQTPGEQTGAEENLKTSEVPPVKAREAIYTARTFRMKKGGESLENKIFELAAKAGGNINSSDWTTMPTHEGAIRVTATVPTKAGELNYAFLVDVGNKSVLPENELGKAAYASLAVERVRKAPARTPRKKAAPKARTKPVAKPQKAVQKAELPPDSEYEYVYVDEDGNEEPAE